MFHCYVRLPECTFHYTGCLKTGSLFHCLWNNPYILSPIYIYSWVGFHLLYALNNHGGLFFVAQLFFVEWFLCIELPTASTPPIGYFQLVWLKHQFFSTRFYSINQVRSIRFLYIRYMWRIEISPVFVDKNGKLSRVSNLQMRVMLRPRIHHVETHPNSRSCLSSGKSLQNDIPS